jgi:hypothetical protein
MEKLAKVNNLCHDLIKGEISPIEAIENLDLIKNSNGLSPFLIFLS